MPYPKHDTKMDPFSERGKAFTPLRWMTECKETGLGRSAEIAVAVVDGDDQGARTVMHRLIRIWNLMRDIPDDQLNECVVLHKSNAKELFDGMIEAIEEAPEAVQKWQAGEQQ